MHWEFDIAFIFVVSLKFQIAKKIKLNSTASGHLQNLTGSQETEQRLKQIIMKALFQLQIHQWFVLS